MTFALFAKQWHDARVAAGEVGQTRLKREECIINDLNAHIGGVRLRDLTSQSIEQVYTLMREEKLEKSGKCLGTTMNMVHKLLKQILNKAVDYDIILRNPADKVPAPKVDAVDRRSLSASEARDLIARIDAAELAGYAKRDGIERRQAARKDTAQRGYLRSLSAIGNVIAVRIGLATGMRRGEVLALTWDHIDLEGATIQVEKSITVYGEVKDPKSEAGKRCLNIDGETLEHLRSWKAYQASELDKICITQTGSTPVCCSDKGEFVNPTNFSRWWRSFAEESGFPHLKFHELRHTQASQLIANGVDIKTVQGRLGHASATLTMNQYAHALPENDKKAAELIGTLFSLGQETDEALQLTA